MIFAAMMDLFTMTIPNRISIILVAAFLIAAPVTGMAWEQFFVHVGTGVAVLAIGIALFAFGLLGGGDAKLLAAASLWIGFDYLGQYMFMVVLMGGALSIVLLAYRGMSAAAMASWPALGTALAQQEGRDSLRFGPFWCGALDFPDDGVVRRSNG